VKGLLSHDKGKTFRRILEELESLEQYTVYWDLLNTKDYGIPQSRSRIFLVGFRVDVQTGPFNFPEKLDMKNIHSYIDQSDNSSRELPPRVAKVNYMDKIPSDASFIDFSLYGHSHFPNAGIVCSCICRKSEIWCVPKQRFANCKEILSLQGFPKDFKQVVSNTQIKRQVGNSMSVNVLVEIFKECMKAVE